MEDARSGALSVPSETKASATEPDMRPRGSHTQLSADSIWRTKGACWADTMDGVGDSDEARAIVSGVDMNDAAGTRAEW